MNWSAVFLHDLSDLALYLIKLQVAYERFTSRPLVTRLGPLLLSSDRGYVWLGCISFVLQVIRGTTALPIILVSEGLTLHLHLMKLHLVQVSHSGLTSISHHIINWVHIVKLPTRAFERPFCFLIFHWRHACSSLILVSLKTLLLAFAPACVVDVTCWDQLLHLQPTFPTTS